jgi:hypothetical protein
LLDFSKTLLRPSSRSKPTWRRADSANLIPRGWALPILANSLSAPFALSQNRHAKPLVIFCAHGVSYGQRFMIQAATHAHGATRIPSISVGRMHERSREAADLPLRLLSRPAPVIACRLESGPNTPAGRGAYPSAPGGGLSHGPPLSFHDRFSPRSVSVRGSLGH